MSPARTRRARPGGTRRRTSSGPVRAGSRGAADSRPGRRTTRNPARTTPVRRGPRSSGRTVLLAATVLLLALTLAGPLRQYVAGRQQLAELAAEQSALSQRAADLQAQLDQRRDPAYVEQQARERLTLVPPGSRLVIVGDAGGPGDTAEPPTGLPDPGAPLPWYEALLDSVARADG